MDLKKLTKQIPYKWRVQSFSEYKPEATCVAYIDARDVMDLLDEVCSPENWQDDYKVVDGKLFAGIGIKKEDIWIWKWDTGTESNVEKEKGQVSDSFKRAAVKWGIGRFLYSLEIKRVAANEKKTTNPKNYPYPVDASGKRIWNLTKHFQTTTTSNKTAQTTTPPSKPKQPLIDFASKINACTDLEQLKTVWQAIPPEQKTWFTEVKEEKKKQLNNLPKDVH